MLRPPNLLVQVAPVLDAHANQELHTRRVEGMQMQMQHCKQICNVSRG